MTRPMDPNLAPGNQRDIAGFPARHVGWTVRDNVGTVTLNRPERKNPLTFDAYAELRDLFRALAQAGDVRAVVVQGAGGNFCSGGDVHEIIGPLTKMRIPDLLTFTRMTGDVVKAIRACPQPVVAAIDGVCAGAGAIIAMASDLRVGTPRSQVAFLFSRVGLAGCDMGACSILPRIVGQGRASELLLTGRAMDGNEAASLGILQSPRDAGRCRSGCRRVGRRARRRSDVRPRHDQTHAPSGMGDGHRPGDRSGSTGAGHLHDDRGFRARPSRLHVEVQARVRG